MNTLKDIRNVFCRYKLAMSLNLIGLSLAFAIFYMIMKQVWFEYNFDRSYPEFEKIFQVEVVGTKLISSGLHRPIFEQMNTGFAGISCSGMSDIRESVFFSSFG